MDRTSTDAEHLIPRYLAGELSAAQNIELEQYWSQHPEILKDVEYTLRLKEGLAILQSRGELTQLLKRRTSPLWIVGAAAALVLVTLGLWGWRHPLLRSPVMAASRFDLVGSDRHALPVAGHYVLVRDRGPASAIWLQLPRERDAIELQVLPSEPSAANRYWISLTRVDSAGRRTVLQALDAIEAADDRYVTVFLDSARLIPGPYEISLGADPRGAVDNSSDHFALQMK